MAEGFSLPLFTLERTGHQVQPAEQAGLATLVATYSALLFRVAYSVVRSRSEAEDVVQDVFLRVIEKRSSLSGIREMRVWLVRIAWNLALDRRRRTRPEQMNTAFAEALASRTVPADAALADAQQMAAVLREMDRLPRAEREALLLSAVEELSTAEVAQVLGRSDSAVRALLFRARTRLRQRLEAG